jgi:hypothetical protein
VNGEWVTSLSSNWRKPIYLAARRGFGENSRGFPDGQMARRLGWGHWRQCLRLINSRKNSASRRSCKAPALHDTATIQC